MFAIDAESCAAELDRLRELAVECTRSWNRDKVLTSYIAIVRKLSELMEGMNQDERMLSSFENPSDTVLMTLADVRYGRDAIWRMTIGIEAQLMKAGWIAWPGVA
jgi:hypothetical protein